SSQLPGLGCLRPSHVPHDPLTHACWPGLHEPPVTPWHARVSLAAHVHAVPGVPSQSASLPEQSSVSGSISPRQSLHFEPPAVSTHVFVPFAQMPLPFVPSGPE